MKRYNPQEIEPKWQKYWAANKTYEVTEDSTKPKIYATPMLPYPSGAAMHVGHVRNYAIADAVARYHRQKGFNTMSNMAWDAFGLPAENYAIKTGTPPSETTKKNSIYFKEQLQALAMSYAWDREFTTSDPSYYKWTQWIFTKLFEHGLAYQAEKAQWWCDQCKTVLADEQVVDGKCWRHDNPEDPKVIKKTLKQWFFKITKYADELLETTDVLTWPEKIKVMQKNWIGRSEGASVRFQLEGLGADGEHLEVFTTAHDTIYGATFMVVAPEHPIVTGYAQFAENAVDISEYVEKSVRKSELDREIEKNKTGVPLEGLVAVNPLNGDKIPVWVADYVLISYGTGAIMAVPGEDERDNEFAKKYDLLIIFTTEQQEFTSYGDAIKPNRKAYKLANSGEFDGLDFETGRTKILEKIVSTAAGEAVVQYKMRDWLISRQRYWGAPIPIVYCKKDGVVAVPEKDLPVLLPEVKNFAPDGSNHSVLAGVKDWVNTTCPKCGGPATRETDTMDGYACSSWYMYRYTDAHNVQQAWGKDKADYWFPVDFYFGGDHAVSHLLYFRFWHKFFCDIGLVDQQKIGREPVKRLVFNGYINAEDGTKMSKSKGNTIDPMEIITSGYGADALRVFELFIAPYDQDTSWNTHGVPGTYRFLNRLWTLAQEYIDAKPGDVSAEITKQVTIATHKTIKKVTHDLESLSFNTAIAAMMELTNELFLAKAKEATNRAEAWQFAVESLVQLVAPFAPHVAEELWHQLGHEDSVHIGHWPAYDDALLVKDTITLAVQVNGKVRTEITVSSHASKDEVIAAGLADENVQKYLENKEPAKTIYVAGRILNFVG